jgi:hypothetical protein
MLWIVGLPRSGTTWLGKTLDSHPQVIYRHEPDSVLRADDLPLVCPDSDIEGHRERASRYLEHWRSLRAVKVAGSLPAFPKAYRSPLTQIGRHVWAMTAKTLEKSRLGGLSGVPDLVGLGAPQPTTVLKSIESAGRVNLLLDACPHMRVVVVLRDPCGQVASVLRGIRLGKFSSSVPDTENFGVFRMLTKLPQAERFGLDEAAFRSMQPYERLAWRWVLLNDKLLTEAERDPRVYVVGYEELCFTPTSAMQGVFRFAGLPWHSQTEDFLIRSTRGKRGSSYYGVFRDSHSMALRWRAELAEDVISRIESIALQSRVGRLLKKDPFRLSESTRSSTAA